MHGITISDYGIERSVTSSTEPTIIEFTADKKGTFKIYCSTCEKGIFGARHPKIEATLVVN
jgi:heme/copper-type cytochrome/quinol oxidase subunit 2